MSKEIATQETASIVDVVSKKVRDLESAKQINFPVDFSPENALKTFWLILQSTRDRNGKSALEVCSRDSIVNAMLDMVLQGLSPSKKQCYAIIYGKQLQLQRSYFGTQAIAMRVLNAEYISAQTIHKGETFEFDTSAGIKVVTKHVRTLTSLGNEIIGAYCVVKMPTYQYTEIMTFDEIKQSWKQSKMNPVSADGKINANSVHGKFTQEMAKKTVINRTLKSLINSSSDNDLVISAFNRTTRNEFLPENEVSIANVKPFNQPEQKQEEAKQPVNPFEDMDNDNTQPEEGEI